MLPMVFIEVQTSLIKQTAPRIGTLLLLLCIYYSAFSGGSQEGAAFFNHLIMWEIGFTRPDAFASGRGVSAVEFF